MGCPGDAPQPHRVQFACLMVGRVDGLAQEYSQVLVDVGERRAGIGGEHDAAAGHCHQLARVRFGASLEPNNPSPPQPTQVSIRRAVRRKAPERVDQAVRVLWESDRGTDAGPADAANSAAHATRADGAQAR